MEGIVDQRKTYLVADEIDISEDDDASQGVDLGGRPIMGLIVPALNDTPDLTVEVSVDGGSNWVDLLQDDGSTQGITITGGASAFAVSSDDLSPLAAYCGGEHSDVLVRLVASVAQTSDRAFTWVVCG